MKHKRSTVLRAVGTVVVVGLAVWTAGGKGGASTGGPSPDQQPLDPLSIPKFAHELPIPRVFHSLVGVRPVYRDAFLGHAGSLLASLGKIE